MKVPAFFIGARQRERQLVEAAKKPRNSKAARLLGQGLGRRSPGPFSCPLFTQVRGIGILGSSLRILP